MNPKISALKSLMKSQYALMRKLDLILKDEPAQPKPFNCEAEKIIQAVNNEFNVICTGTMKTARVSDARSVAMYLLDKHTKLNLTEIAVSVGRNHHSTVIAGRQKVKSFINIYPEFREKVNNIEQIIKN